MTPLLTLWPDHSTANLDVRTAALLQPYVDKELYDFIPHSGMKDGDLVTKLEERYRRHIGLNAIDTTLHVVAVLPAYTGACVDEAGHIIRAIRESRDKFSLHIILLQEGLAKLLADTPGNDARGLERANVKAVDDMCVAAGFRCSFSPLDNYISTGATAEITGLDILSRYLATVFTMMMDDYAALLPPSIFADSDSRMLAMGLSSIEFDRSECTAHLLYDAFLASLDNSKVTLGEVDSQESAQRVLEALSGIDRFFSDFYRHCVTPLYDRGDDPSQIAASVSRPLDTEVGNLRRRITSFMDSRKLSLPEKEATFALLLGQDSRLLRGVQYDQESLLVDDALREPMSFFIDIFNRAENATGLLPVRGDFPGLKKYVWDSEKNEMVESVENKEAFDPIGKIKRLKRQLQDESAYIRDLEGTIARLGQQEKNREIIEGPGISPNRHRRITDEIVEQPLNETYTPSTGLRPQPSVDLRKYFSPIKAQGEIGSCATFATVAIYESIMNRANPTAPHADMSERFVFYYSNVTEGKPEGGSNYARQLEVLGKYGVCHESQCHYSREKILEKPSQEAIDEAQSHRVLSARQICLHSTGNKIECMQENHRLLTSALSEGYPVGIGLKVYDSLDTITSPYVSRPSEEEILSGKSSNHAMVLVGYSESDKYYIVRNSWGPDYGDKGYIYVSAAYIDDPDFNHFACIITETTEKGADGIQTRPPELVTPFQGTENQIKSAIAHNALDEATVRFNTLQREYREIYEYYGQLLESLSNHNVREKLRELAEEQAADAFLALNNRREQLTKEFTGALKAFRHSYIKTASYVTGIAFIADIGFLMSLYNGLADFSEWLTWAPGLVMTVASIVIWSHYFWAVRRKRRELQKRIDDLHVMEERIRREYLEKRLRFHVAGMAIDRIKRMKQDLDEEYQRLMGYNKSLRLWHEEYTRVAMKPMRPSEAMFRSVYDAGLVARYFSRHRQRIASGIDLTEGFRGYLFDKESADTLRSRFEARTRRSVEELFDSFSFADWMLDNRRYDYISPADIPAIATVLMRMAMPTTRLADFDSSRMSLYLSVMVPHNMTARWEMTTSPCFPYPPSCCASTHPDRLTLLTLIALPPSCLRH